MTQEEQQYATDLLAIWVASDIRLFTIVEDKGFRRYVDYIKSIRGSIKVPSRQVIAERVPAVTSHARSILHQKLQNQCKFYSASSDIWTLRAKDSYISFTIHYITDDFFMKSWLLEVRHLPGKHTGIAIASELEKCIELWGLKKENCVKFVRDGAANGVKACNELQINHMSCLAHSLHLVVAAGLINKLKEKM